MREPEDEDDWDADDDDDVSYIPCPNCGEEMYEDADYCPTCETWISRDVHTANRRSWWVVIIVLALIAAIILAFV